MNGPDCSAWFPGLAACLPRLRLRLLRPFVSWPYRFKSFHRGERHAACWKRRRGGGLLMLSGCVVVRRLVISLPFFFFFFPLSVTPREEAVCSSVSQGGGKLSWAAFCFCCCLALISTITLCSPSFFAPQLHPSTLLHFLFSAQPSPNRLGCSVGGRGERGLEITFTWPSFTQLSHTHRPLLLLLLLHRLMHTHTYTHTLIHTTHTHRCMPEPSSLHENDGQRHSPLHGPGTQTVCSWWLSWLPPPSPP